MDYNNKEKREKENIKKICNIKKYLYNIYILILNNKDYEKYLNSKYYYR